jgi:phosphoribosylformylglycinamidine cyclo-ligase
MEAKGLTYAISGVDSEEEERGLSCLLKWIRQTHSFSQDKAKLRLDIGYFANVIDLGNNLGIVISTDGVGTKLLIAQLMNRYETIGIDCVAMNVNDVICVGAEPITMLDYLAVERPQEDLLEAIGRGLYEGAKIANITISGGELAQVREMIKGKRQDYGFDLVGMAIGIVPMDKLILGQEIEEDDVIIGLKSSGIHSNGLTLARRALLEKGRLKVDDYIRELGRTLGEELLEPTHIYVPEIREMKEAQLKIKALVNITGQGLLNLARINRAMGYVIYNLPEPQPIFYLIQRYGHITDEEMFKVFNMGIGFCVIISEADAEKVIEIARRYQVQAYQIGHVIKDKERKIIIEPAKLIGKQGRFYPF